MNSAEITKAMIADLSRSGLTTVDVKKLQLSTAKHSLKPETAGYVIPYFDSNGKKTKFYRVRYVESTLTGFSALTGRKPLRYNQPPNTVNEVYLPPYIDWKAHFASNEPLIITEGEKKSAAATKEGLPTIGLGGVWCFMSKRIEAPLLPIFDEMNLDKRTVCICFDSDAATNPDILMAEETLARRLIEKGANVYIARIPARKGRKVGLDDYIQAYSARKFQRNILLNAFEYSRSKELHRMNADVVYIRELGLVYDHTHDMRLSPTSFTQHAHSNRWINVATTDKEGNTKMVRKSAAKLWLEWEHRAELSGMTYAPGKPRITEDDELNVWKGWGVDDAVRGDVTPWVHLLDLLFDGTPKSRQWFERWCAYPIQHPGVKMASAAVMWGVSQGTGKTLCGHTLMRLYGRNATEVKDSDLEDARFAWAENKQFVLADDITGHNNRKLSNMFKTMVTQKTLHINPKYVPSYSVPDCINYYFTSNDPDAFYLDDKDRRFFIHEVLIDCLPEELRRRFVKWRDSDAGISALFYHLLQLDLGDFDPQAPALQTSAKQDMQHISKSDLGAWVAKLKEEPDTVLNGKFKGDLFTAEELHVVYDPLGVKRASPNALARELKRSGFVKMVPPAGGAYRICGRQLRLYCVRNPAQWKKAKLQDINDHYISTHQLPKEKF
jgi:hypothetical protein